MTISGNAAVDAGKDAKLAEKRRALGRGLESLLPGPRVVPPAVGVASPAQKQGTAPGAAVPAASSSAAPSSESGISLHASAGAPATGEIVELPLDAIEENPHQTRLDFDPKLLSDLAGSIQEQGVLQPIMVRPRVATYSGPPRYTLIMGERRFRASKMAGKTTIPAIIKRVSEQQAAEITLVENLQRQDLDCIEQANAFAHLANEFRMKHEDIGKRVGASREQVSNYMRLLNLPPQVLELIRRKALTFSHARLLLALKSQDSAQIVTVAQTVVEKKMSVALLEELVMNANNPMPKAPLPSEGTGRWVDPNVRAAQRSLEAALGMRVRIRDRKGKGKIVIEYGTLEDFDRVVGMLSGK